MELLNFVVAEKATMDHFSIDRIMNAIVKSFSVLDQHTEMGSAERFIGKLTMTQYTYEGLQNKAQVRDGDRNSVCSMLWSLRKIHCMSLWHFTKTTTTAYHGSKVQRCTGRRRFLTAGW